MRTITAVAIYAPFAAITIVILVLELSRSFKRHEDHLFTVLCLCIACWFASDIASLITTSYSLLRFLYNFKLIFVGLVPPVLLLFVLRFYKVWMGKHEKLLKVLLFAVPVLNIPVVLTSSFHSLMTTIQLITMTPVREFHIIWGLWFWVHTIQSYVVSLGIITVVIVRHFRMPRFYRMPSSLMSLGIFITLMGNVITLLQLLPPILDPTLITCSLSLILFDFAIINNNKSKFVHFSHKHIYNYLDEYILILDDSQRVLEWNSPADDWFARWEIPLKDTTFLGVLQALLRKEGAYQAEAEGQAGVNIYLPHSDFPVVLNLRLHEITDAHGDAIGSIAVFADVTQTWTLIDRLEEKAGVDSLTGIPNHMAYTGAKERLDSPEHLPLSIVACDANGLKQVNDTLGHQYGDLMLKVIAEVLEKSCAPPNFVARTGGDEFICLLPETSEEAAAELIVQIRDAMDALKQYSFPISVALGAATKFEPEQDLDALIAQADSNMYQNKKQIKETVQESVSVV